MFRGAIVIDGHADILYQMGCRRCSYYDPAAPLHQSYAHLAASGVDLQVFVTFVDPDRAPGEQLYKVLNRLHAYRSEVERPDAVRTVLTAADLRALAADREAGGRARHALLSVEGADALNGEMAVLDTWFRLGVRLVGLTWNGANCLADGVGELRGAGLTNFGRDVVRRMQTLGMLVDVSHLSPRGVSDVLEMAEKPVVASHSNAQSVHRHRRNLDDGQIRAVAAGGGLVGATFVPAFIGDRQPVNSDDLLRHIDRMLTVAGPDAVGLGSDFDGIEETPSDLRNGSDYPILLNKLEEHFGVDVARKVMGGNWFRVLSQTLPA